MTVLPCPRAYARDLLASHLADQRPVVQSLLAVIALAEPLQVGHVDGKGTLQLAEPLSAATVARQITALAAAIEQAAQLPCLDDVGREVAYHDDFPAGHPFLLIGQSLEAALVHGQFELPPQGGTLEAPLPGHLPQELRKPLQVAIMAWWRFNATLLGAGYQAFAPASQAWVGALARLHPQSCRHLLEQAA